MEDKRSIKVIEGSKEKEDRSSSRGSEFAENRDVFCVDNGTQKVIVKFPEQDSSPTASSVDPFQLDQQFPICFLRAIADNEESLYSSSNLLVTSFISGVNSFPLHGELVQSSTDTHPARSIQIPTVLRSTRDYRVQFFLSFHQENINEFHYFCYHDYRKFCTTTLMTMVEQSDALRNAVVAFSALIYSVKIDRSARVQAFSYYALALQQLRILLDQITMNVDECHMAIATALQLACFDVITNSMTMLIDSVSSMIQSNVSDICKLVHAFCSSFPIQFAIVPQLSDVFYSNGIAAVKATVVC